MADIQKGTLGGRITRLQIVQFRETGQMGCFETGSLFYFPGTYRVYCGFSSVEVN
jgi:hypothetical protein